MNQINDRYLLFRIRRKHDKAAFGEIYDSHVKAIFRFTLLKVPTKEEAQDITSDVFLRTWKYLLTEKKVMSIRALMYRIARNCIADFYKKREITYSLDAVTNHPELQTYIVRASDNEEARAELGLLFSKMSDLKDDYRDVLTLRLIEGLSFREIGDILEKSAGNVRVIYHRAVKTLRQ